GRFGRAGTYGSWLRLFRAVVLGEAAWRPVGLGSGATARAMERGDVLQRDQDVAVQLDVRHVFDDAVGGEDTVLVVAAEERDLDLLALVLVRVVLHVRPVYWRRTRSNPREKGAEPRLFGAPPGRVRAARRCGRPGTTPSEPRPLHRRLTGARSARPGGCDGRRRRRPRGRRRGLLGSVPHGRQPGSARAPGPPRFARPPR